MDAASVTASKGSIEHWWSTALICMAAGGGRMLMLLPEGKLPRGQATQMRFILNKKKYMG